MNVYISSTNDVIVDKAKVRATGTYVNNGTCTYQLKDSASTVVTSGTCTFVTASNGRYLGTIASTVTLTAGGYYVLEVTFTSSSGNAFVRVEDVLAAYRVGDGS